MTRARSRSTGRFHAYITKTPFSRHAMLLAIITACSLLAFAQEVAGCQIFESIRGPVIGIREFLILCSCALVLLCSFFLLHRPIPSHSVLSTKCHTSRISDLGSTTSSVAIQSRPKFDYDRNRRVDIIANSQGHRTTPTCVAFVDKRCLVGSPAKNASDYASTRQENIVFNAKRLIGRSLEDAEVQKDMRMNQWSLTVHADKRGRSMSSMSDTHIVGETFPTASRREKDMEPYPTLKGLVDSGMAGSSSGAGTKRRRRRMNMRPTAVFSRTSQSSDMCVQWMYMSMVVVHMSCLCLQTRYGSERSHRSTPVQVASRVIAVIVVHVGMVCGDV
jgi:hypothetical protein